MIKNTQYLQSWRHYNFCEKSQVQAQTNFLKTFAILLSNFCIKTFDTIVLISTHNSLATIFISKIVRKIKKTNRSIRLQAGRSRFRTKGYPKGNNEMPRTSLTPDALHNTGIKARCQCHHRISFSKKKKYTNTSTTQTLSKKAELDLCSNTSVTHRTHRETDPRANGYKQGERARQMYDAPVHFKLNGTRNEKAIKQNAH